MVVRVQVCVYRKRRRRQRLQATGSGSVERRATHKYITCRDTCRHQFGNPVLFLQLVPFQLELEVVQCLALHLHRILQLLHHVLFDDGDSLQPLFKDAVFPHHLCFVKLVSFLYVLLLCEVVVVRDRAGPQLPVPYLFRRVL